MTNGTRRGWGVSVTPWPLFTPRKNLVLIVQEAVWAPGSVWTGAENLAPPPGFDPRTVQPVASRYIDWATGPTATIILIVICTLIHSSLCVLNFHVTNMETKFCQSPRTAQEIKANILHCISKIRNRQLSMKLYIPFYIVVVSLWRCSH